MRRSAIILALALLAPHQAWAQTGARLRGAAEGAIVGAMAGAGAWAAFCDIAEPDDDLDAPLCALWGAVYHAPLGLVAGVGLGSRDAASLGGRVRIVGLGTAAGLAMGAVAAGSAGGDFSNLSIFGAMGMGTGIVVAAVGPWLHARFGRPVTIAPTGTGFAVRVGGR